MIPVSVRIHDAVLTGAERTKAVKRVIAKIEKQGGGIILLHDARESHSRMEQKLGENPGSAFDRSWIPEAVEEIIITLKSKGFIFASQGYVLEL